MSKEIPFISTELRQEAGLRLRKLTPLIKESGADAILLASNTNLYYAAGRFFRGYVYITSEGEALYFIIRPDIFAAEEDLIPIRKPEMIPDILRERGISLPSRIGIEHDSLSWSDCTRLQNLFPEAEIINASPVMRRARMQKTPYEISLIRQDGLHQTAVYHKVSRLYQRDMTDLEFQIEIERVLRLEGSLGTLRVSGNLMEINMGSVIAGDNADNPSPYDFAMGGAGVDPSLPGGASGEIIRHGQTIMVDMNGNFNGYNSDMTRVWSLGEVSPLARKAHNCSIKILRELESTTPGTKVSDMYHRAMEIVEAEGLTDYFMGHRQQAAFIGHGIGIELNEQPAITPRSRDIVLQDMTLAIEPKFVIPGVGAVGIENSYVVTPTGLDNLTSFPEDIINLL